MHQQNYNSVFIPKEHVKSFELIERANEIRCFAYFSHLHSIFVDLPELDCGSCSWFSRAGPSNCVLARNDCDKSLIFDRVFEISSIGAEMSNICVVLCMKLPSTLIKIVVAHMMLHHCLTQLFY